jgi:hypothetical protein
MDAGSKLSSLKIVPYDTTPTEPSPYSYKQKIEEGPELENLITQVVTELKT